MNVKHVSGQCSTLLHCLSAIFECTHLRCEIFSFHLFFLQMRWHSGDIVYDWSWNILCPSNNFATGQKGLFKKDRHEVSYSLNGGAEDIMIMTWLRVRSPKQSNGIEICLCSRDLRKRVIFQETQKIERKEARSPKVLKYLKNYKRGEENELLLTDKETGGSEKGV